MINIEKYQKVIELDIIQLIYEFMDLDEDCGFKKSHVAKLSKILNAYIEQLSALENVTDKKILSVVKKAVLAINRLNEQTDYCMIETNERESICMLIINAAAEAGYSVPNTDITEEWREW